MSFLEFLVKIQGIIGGIIGVILGFILRGFREKGELYGFLHDDEVKMVPKGKRVGDKGRAYANVNDIEDAYYGGCALNIEVINEARLPKKLIIHKIKFEMGNREFIGDVINIEINGNDYTGEKFITLKANSSVKGKFYIEVTKEDLKKIKSNDNNFQPKIMIGHDSKRKEIEMTLY